MTQNGSRPRSGVASKELAAARRRKRHRQVIRNRIIFGMVCGILLGIIIFAIVKIISVIAGGHYNEADSSILKFNEDGTVTYEEIIDFDEDIYSKKELKEYTNNLVERFNENYGADTITLDKFRVKDGVAYIRTTYESADAYATFTSYEVYWGTADGAREAGYDFENIIVSAIGGMKGEAIEFDNPGFFNGMDVVVIKENTTVSVPGDIKYISKYNTSLNAENQVIITPDDGNMDAEDYVYIIFSKDEK